MIQHHDIVQGSDEWIAARCGLLTASEMKLIITPTLKIASNMEERRHLYELAAQRVNQYVEPSFISEDMLRGYHDEDVAVEHYSRAYAPVIKMGFITNNRWGYTLGYSPDGLVGDDGLIEVKSRRQGLHMRTILEDVAADKVAAEHVIQVQSGLFVSERDWIDCVSYSGGMPMTVVRAYPIPEVHAAINQAAEAFEERLADAIQRYRGIIARVRAVPTQRISYEDIAA